MNADRFDEFARSLPFSRPRRSVLAGALGAGLTALLASFGREDADARKKRKKRKRRKRRKNKKRCMGGTKTCGKSCIPTANCCTSEECGVNEKCATGACVSCLPQGTACTDDSQCCTDICDAYTNKCQQVRVSCADGEPCPNGRCCDEFGPQCLYITATQLECVPDGQPNRSCGYLLCGDQCSDLADGTYEFCGYYGSAACRNGRCCCPEGIPLEDCPSSAPGSPPLPRCPD